MDNSCKIQTRVRDLVFTRYLYVKDEVEIALLISILSKSEDSLFWAFELHYSKLTNDLFHFIWKIYYDFFATLNPGLELYLQKKEKEYLTTFDATILGAIISNLLIRPFNIDVFLLQKCCSLFEIEVNYHKNTPKITNIDDFRINMTKWMETCDYRSFSQWLLNENKEDIPLSDIYDVCLEELTKGKCSKKTDFNGIIGRTDKKIICLSKIMHLFSKQKNLIMGKNIYISVVPEDFVIYETVCGSNDMPSYRVLENACICGINDLGYLGLFKLKRTKYNLQDKYLNHWLYYATFSPLWLQRVSDFGGSICVSQETILFEDDDKLEAFYELYGLEPDEQKVCVQQKSIVPILKTQTWKHFYNTFRKNGLFEIWEEELEEMDIDGIVY